MLGSLGHFIRETALYWLAYEITGSAFALGLLSLCEAAPRLILGLFAGVVVDRVDRLRLLIVNQGLGSVPVFVLAGLYFAGALEFWQILLVEAIYASIRSVVPSASQSLIRDFVPPDTLFGAVSLYSLGFNVARVVGPSIGGVLLVWIGPGFCFLIHATSLVASVALMMWIRVPARRFSEKRRNLMGDFTEGIRYVWAEPVIRCSIGAAWAISIFVGTYNRFLPVFAKNILGVGPEGLGLMMAAPGVGAVIALAVLSTWGEKWNREVMAWTTAAMTPLVLFVFCLSSYFVLSLVMLGFLGAAHVGFRTVSRLIIQVEVPYELLGRVMSVFLMDQGLRSVGSLALGTSVSLLGAAWGLGSASIIALLLINLLYIRLYSKRLA